MEANGCFEILPCNECGAPFEIVRPGKYQPTCDCQDKCETCGSMRRHFAQGEIARRLSGFLCPVCDADDHTTGAIK